VLVGDGEKATSVDRSRLALATTDRESRVDEAANGASAVFELAD